ncbi:hypothetical protein [Paraflavitalea sp. CAU 1676]|uniref:hypothetical protein n=1 Tax=Paraflavitalea sp. CAU 1676 TaxID=3032598 RepID=UPI0023DB1E58|nr:hypothetical protein [Paraflavitalea sp. CAU 1676]MDF2193258.1 hypothetical protein [Paraflavitalea sp. CAU 1676]
MKTSISNERSFKRIVKQGSQFDAIAPNDSTLENKQVGGKKTGIAGLRIFPGHFLAGPHAIFNPLLVK